MFRLLIALALLLPVAAFARDWQVDAAQEHADVQGQLPGRSVRRQVQEIRRDDRVRRGRSDASRSSTSRSISPASTPAAASATRRWRRRDFFDTAKTPKAHFVTESFAKDGDGSVEAKGNLTIRNQTKPVTLKVKFAENGNAATLDVDTTLKRADFDLGNGSDWADIGADVPVHGHLVLTGK